MMVSPVRLTNKPITNTERLRTHLADDSLAAALAIAWEQGGDAKQQQNRMLEALKNFSKAKEEANDATTNN